MNPTKQRIKIQVSGRDQLSASSCPAQSNRKSLAQNSLADPSAKRRKQAGAASHKSAQHHRQHLELIKTEPSPFSRHHLHTLNQKLRSLAGKAADTTLGNTGEVPPKSCAMTCVSLNYIERLVPGEADSKVRLFEDWEDMGGHRILRDREEFSLKVRKCSQIRLIVNSRFRRLPLTIDIKRERKRFLEVYLDFDRFPDRDRHSLMSSDDRLLVSSAYAGQITSDFSIRLTVYFYGDDAVSLLPQFQIQLKPYSVGDLKWTEELYNYSQYYEMSLHQPAQRKPRGSKSGSAPQKQRAASPQTTNKTLLDLSPKRLDTASTKARVTFTDTFRASSAAPARNRGKSSDPDPETRLALFDKTNSTFYSALNGCPGASEGFAARTKSPAQKSAMESIQEQRENSSAYFFFKKKQDVFRDRVVKLDQQIDSAQSRRQALKAAKKQSILKSLEFKLIRAEKARLQTQGLLARCVRLGVLRGWVQNLCFFRTLDLFSQLVRGKAHRNSLTNRLYTTVMFYLRLKRRAQFCRSARPFYELGQAKAAIRMAVGLSDGLILRRAHRTAGRLLAEAHKAFNLRRQFQVSFIRMTEIKIRFKQHMFRRAVLKQAFLGELSKYNAVLVDRSGSLPFEYVDVTWKYQNQLFEMFFNRRLNEKLAREVRKTIANRVKSRLVKRANTNHIKFHSLMDNMERSHLFEARVSGQEHYRLFELILHRLEKEMANYQDLVTYLVDTNSSPTAFNRTVKKVRVLSRLSILNPAVIFDPMAMLNKHQISLQFSAAQYLCMLASMADYNGAINKRALIKKSSTLQD